MTWFPLILLASILVGGANQQSKALFSEENSVSSQWQWCERNANLLYGVLQHLNTYDVRITVAANPEQRDEPFDVRIEKKGRLLHSFRAHNQTAIARAGDVVYVARYSPICPGCSVVAFDLRQQKELWKTPLVGNPPSAWSDYDNQVILVIERDLIVVFGRESNGRYIECLDARSGKFVRNKKLPPSP